MPISGDPHPLYVGLEQRVLTDIHATITKAHNESFDFIVVPVAAPPVNNPRCICQSTKYDLRVSTESDLVLNASVWKSAVCGTISNWINPDEAGLHTAAREYMIDAFQKELQWATHVSLYATICPIPNQRSCIHYSRIISQHLGGVHSTTQLWIRVPILYPLERDRDGERDGWEVWDRVRTVCDYSRSLGVALELTKLPVDSAKIDRWLSEPVKAIIIPPEVFVAINNNPMGGESSDFRLKLPQSTLAFLYKMFQHNVQIVIGGSNSLDGTDLPLPFIASAYNTVKHAWRTCPSLSPAERFAVSHRDILQTPLQPLQENVESIVYEVFERDPVKYIKYEDAVVSYLKKWQVRGCSARPRVFVVGAGRGPLVSSVLRAVKTTGVALEALWAVEKSSCAAVTLRSRVTHDPDEGWRSVHVVEGDMRSMRLQERERADLLVSELLGSWGCNELSPECLDGAEMQLLKTGGASIPTRYVSSVEPVMAFKAWSEARLIGGGGSGADAFYFPANPAARSLGTFSGLETPFVCKLHDVFKLSEEGPRSVFEFSHPSKSELDIPGHNRRVKDVSFTAKTDCRLFGFSGYFHCDLFDTNAISTDPRTESADMFSWFPYFLPIREPVPLNKGDKIEATFWREEDLHRVWYEWVVTIRKDGGGERVLPIHNPNGRASAMRK